MPNHSLLWVLQSRRLMSTLVTERHTPTYAQAVTEKHLLSHCCLELRPHPESPGCLIINAQGRVTFASIVFRENRSQDAGPDAGATGVPALVDRASVGTQDLDLKDLVEQGLLSSFLWLRRGSALGILWQGIQGIRCTEGTEVVRDTAGKKMMKSSSTLGGVRRKHVNTSWVLCAPTS